MAQIENDILQILKPQFPLQSIIDLKVNTGSMTGDNFTCKVYSVSFTLCDEEILSSSENFGESGTVKHFVVKCFPDNPDRCEFIAKTSIFEKELGIYQELFPELIRFQENHKDKNGERLKNMIYPFPKFIFGNYASFDSTNATPDPDSFAEMMKRNYIVMEDIRYSENYRTTNSRKEGLDYNHCRIAFVELAKVHALSLIYRQTELPGQLLNEKFKCLEETLITRKTESLRSKILENCASVGISFLEEELSKDSPHFKKIKLFEGKIMQILAHFVSGDANSLTFSQMVNTIPNVDKLHSQNKNLKLTDEWYVFCQGDFWASNILFKYSEALPSEPISAKFVDFQLSRENCLTTDLIYLFYMSTTFDLRSHHMNQLLEFYFNAFMEVCHAYHFTPWKNFSLQNLTDKMTKAKIWGTALALLALPIIYSGSEDKNDDKGPSNSVFDGIGRGGDDMTKILKTRLKEIVNEVVDECII